MFPASSSLGMLTTERGYAGPGIVINQGDGSFAPVRFGVGGADLAWNAGVFRADSRDDILFTASGVTGRGFFQNIGSTRRQGVEAGLTVRQGGLRAFLGYTYTEATFRSPLTIGSRNACDRQHDKGRAVAWRGSGLCGLYAGPP